MFTIVKFVGVDDPRVTESFDKKSYFYLSTLLSWSYARRNSKVCLSLTYLEFPLNIMVNE